VRYRVEQLASAGEISVDTVRYYQSRGLLPAPEREGRVAWYGPEHLERIGQIRSLQGKGLTLAAIRRVVSGELDPADADLAAAVVSAGGTPPGVETLDLDTFSARSGVPASLIQAVEREGIRLGRPVDGETRYTDSDIEMVRTALRLLALARDADVAMRSVAERAVDLFDDHVRKPILDTAGDGGAGADQLVDAFGELLPAVTALVSHHFRRVLLEAAEERFEVPAEDRR
jgi:hypothetical protein